MISRFINELGNNISISVRDKGDHIRIYMKGPDSETENIITRKEVRVLKKLLNKILSPKQDT